MVHHGDIPRHHPCSRISSNNDINVMMWSMSDSASIFLNWILRGSSTFLKDLHSLLLKDLAFIILITYFYNLWTYGHDVTDPLTDELLWTFFSGIQHRHRRKSTSWGPETWALFVLYSTYSWQLFIIRFWFLLGFCFDPIRARHREIARKINTWVDKTSSRKSDSILGMEHCAGVTCPWGTEILLRK